MNTNSGPLEGQVALITGAGRGIGRAIAIGYARAGASIVCVSRTRTEVEETALLVCAEGAHAMAAPADVAEFNAMSTLCTAAEKQFGGIDIVVAAAGVALENKPVEDSDVEAWRGTIEVNLIGAFCTAKAAIPALKRRGAGKMTFVGSGMGHRGKPTRSAYAASKAGLHRLVRVLAQELAVSNIAVNELVPGPVLTAFIAGREAQLRAATGAAAWRGATFRSCLNCYKPPTSDSLTSYFATTGSPVRSARTRTNASASL